MMIFIPTRCALLSIKWWDGHHAPRKFHPDDIWTKLTQMGTVKMCSLPILGIILYVHVSIEKTSSQGLRDIQLFAAEEPRTLSSNHWKQAFFVTISSDENQIPQSGRQVSAGKCRKFWKRKHNSHHLQDSFYLFFFFLSSLAIALLQSKDICMSKRYDSIARFTRYITFI